jgi:hypothetical protein
MQATSVYRLTVRGLVSERLASAFEGMTVEPGADTTALVGPIQDQAQLYGLMNRVRDFGLELVRVEEIRA